MKQGLGMMDRPVAEMVIHDFQDQEFTIKKKKYQ